MRQHLPESCIRGPELRDLQHIQQQIAQQDWAALQSYGRGIASVLRVWKLLRVQQRLLERREERMFLLHQLKVIDQQDPQAVAAALCQFDQQRNSSRAGGSEAMQPADVSEHDLTQ